MSARAAGAPAAAADRSTLRKGPAESDRALPLRPFSVAEDVDAEDVDLSSFVAEECSEAAGNQRERLSAWGAIGAPIVVRHDQEEVLGVRSDVRLPQILEVMVVRRGPATLNLGDDASPMREFEHKVRPRAGDEPLLRGQYDLLAKAEPVLSKREKCACTAVLDVMSSQVVQPGDGWAFPDR
jgi:hypothetical protein